MSGLGSLVARVLGGLATLGLQVALTRLLGVESYGIYVYALTWVDVAAIVGAFGFSPASVRFVAEYRAKEQWSLLRGFQVFGRRFVAALSVLCAVLLAGIAWLIMGTTNPELVSTFVIGALLLPFLAAMRVLYGELAGFGRVVTALFCMLLVRPVLILLGILLSVDSIREYAPAAMTINAFATLVVCAAFLLVIRGSIGKTVPRVKPVFLSRKWIRTSRDMLLISGFSLALFQTDTIMVGALRNPGEAGLYSVAARIATVVPITLIAANAILAPRISALFSSRKTEELRHTVRLVSRAAFVASAAIVVALIFLDRHVLQLFGSDFLMSRSAMWVLIAGQVVSVFCGPAILLLNMTDHQGVSAKILGATAVVNLILNLALVPRFGFLGASVATAISLLMWNVLAVRAAWVKVGLDTLAVPLMPARLRDRTSQVNR